MIDVFARSELMREAVRLAGRVAATDTNVLISGESGVGKDLLALFIHAKSPRSGQPMVKIDCATLPGQLFEAELFGYEKGAFTGASEAKPGRFEAAQKGTLVLDEIAHLSRDAQAKLLRVIESREFERLGGRRTIKVDARFIALTNVDLVNAVKQGRFREDLFYRLNVIHIVVPALRDRCADFPKLCQFFIKQHARKHGLKVDRLAAEAAELLAAYDFPGNARELSNIIERAVVVANNSFVEENDLPQTVRVAARVRNRHATARTLAQVEAEYIAEVLNATGGNKTKCARVLGISRKNLYEKIARYKLTH
ncbi:MAG: sigma-54 interaction domain-containing protein [Pyrinomonadaceae bacterium]